MQGMLTGKTSRRKQMPRWEKLGLHHVFGTMAAANRVAEDRHQFRRYIRVTTSCSKEKVGFQFKQIYKINCITI